MNHQLCFAQFTGLGTYVGCTGRVGPRLVSITIEGKLKTSGKAVTIEMIIEGLDPSTIDSGKGTVLVLELHQRESDNKIWILFGNLRCRA